MLFIKQYILTLIIIIVAFCGFAQKQNAVWYFGEKAGIDFNSGIPQGLSNSALSTSEGCASICSPKGKLLFYTDGYSLFDSTHNIMPNGKDVRKNTDWYGTQSALIVLLPGSNHIYYLFTMELMENSLNAFYYSIVDMRLHSGKGDVIQGKRNILLLGSICQKITGTKHSNGKDYWIISINRKISTDTNKVSTTDSLYAWQLTSTGIIYPPVISKTLNKQVGPGMGQMKISPDGKKIAYAIYPNGKDNNSFLLGDFDAGTGKAGNFLSVNLSSVYGLEFSGNSNFLYVSSIVPLKIYQFNAKATSLNILASSKTGIDTTRSYNSVCPLQLGIDGKIYYSELKGKYLHAIYFPDSMGLACQPQKNAVDLKGRASWIGLPNFISSYNKTTQFDLKGTCIHDTSFFSLYGGEDVDSVKWDFGDIKSGANNASQKINDVFHIYENYGDYIIKLVSFSNSETDTFISMVSFKDPEPNFNVKDVCEKDSMLFKNSSSNKVGPLTFKWKFGDGHTSVSESPSHTYTIGGISKTFNVTLTAITDDGCKDSITKPVTVNANPISDFSFSKTQNVVNFKALQSGNTSYKWMFGNGDSSSNKDISYIYPKSGKYEACLTVTDAANCFSKTCKDISITVGISNPGITYGFKIYPNPNAGNFILEVNNPLKNTFIEVYDLPGNLIKTIDLFPDRTSNFIEIDRPNGIYILKVNSPQFIFSEKVIICK